MWMRAVHADMHLGDHGVVAPVCDLLSALSRHEKSARLLPASEVVAALRDVLVGYLGRWDVCSTALRASKHTLPFRPLFRGGRRCAHWNPHVHELRVHV
jgi:hypothetical protein